MTIDVLIVGSGPAGLSAAIELRRRGVERVVVHEREHEPGGVPRHTAHTGFGLRDTYRVMSGPRYADRLVRTALVHGVTIETGLAVRELSGARAYLVATGVRERSRAARLIPGDRPAGIYTTGSLQQLVRAGVPVGKRAVIIGGEHVAFSAPMTLRHAGVEAVAIVTSQATHQTHPVLALAARTRVLTGRSVVEIIGRRRVEAVVLDSGERLACDTVVVSGDWVGEVELARTIGLSVMLPAGRLVTDSSLMTSQRGVFAAGNVLHGAESADVCALEGRHAARRIVDFLSDDKTHSHVEIEVEGGVEWIAPQRLAIDVAPPRNRFIIRVDQPVRGVEVAQNGVTVWGGRIRGVARPLRSCWIPAQWIEQVDPLGGPVAIRAAR